MYFSPRECWPLNTGARLRDYHLASQLARRARVTYLGLRAHMEPPADPPPDSSGFEHVIVAPREPAYTPWKLLRGFTGPHPVSTLNYWSAAAETALTQTLDAGFDTVQIEGVHLVQYLPAIRAHAPGAAIVADWHNIESELLWRYAAASPNPARRMFARRTAVLVERAEARLLEGCDCHTVASDRERVRLQERCPRARLETLPNGVDVEHYASLQPQPDARDIVFVGSMDYHANIQAAQWMVRNAWPQIRAASPGLRLVLAGRRPTAAVRALASADIEVTGTVNDVRPYYERAMAVVAPLQVGSGTRLKILEAMAAGVPVVSTRLGAEGLEVHGEADILFAETGEEFAAAIARLRSSPDLRNRLAIAGRALATERYDWRRLGDLLFQIHQKAARASAFNPSSR